MPMSNSPSSPTTASVLGALGTSNVIRLGIRNPHLDQPRQSSMGSGSALCLGDLGWMEEHGSKR